MRFGGELSDTDPRALEVLTALQRQMPQGDKAALVFQLSQMLLTLAETGVRMQYPLATEREVLLRIAARRLDRDLVQRAYGWDPNIDDRPGDPA